MNGISSCPENDAVSLGNARIFRKNLRLKKSFFGFHEAEAVVEIAVCGGVEVGDYYVSGQ
jgi:hypothetical protein